MMKRYADVNELLLLLGNVTMIKVNDNYYNVENVNLTTNTDGLTYFSFDTHFTNHSRFIISDEIEVYNNILLTYFPTDHKCNNEYGQILLKTKYLIKI